MNSPPANRMICFTGSFVDLDTLDVSTLLPTHPSNYFRYHGSLTTPPCYQSVVWTIFEDKQTLSIDQLKALRTIYETNKQVSEIFLHPMIPERNSDINLVDNYRPLQKTLGRLITTNIHRFSDPEFLSLHGKSVDPIVSKAAAVTPQDSGMKSKQIMHIEPMSAHMVHVESQITNSTASLSHYPSGKTGNITELVTIPLLNHRVQTSSNLVTTVRSNSTSNTSGATQIDESNFPIQNLNVGLSIQAGTVLLPQPVPPSHTMQSLQSGQFQQLTPSQQTNNATSVLQSLLQGQMTPPPNQELSLQTAFQLDQLAQQNKLTQLMKQNVYAQGLVPLVLQAKSNVFAPQITINQSLPNLHIPKTSNTSSRPLSSPPSDINKTPIPQITGQQIPVIEMPIKQVETNRSPQPQHIPTITQLISGSHHIMAFNDLLPAKYNSHILINAPLPNKHAPPSPPISHSNPQTIELTQQSQLPKVTNDRIVRQQIKSSMQHSLNITSRPHITELQRMSAASKRSPMRVNESVMPIHVVQKQRTEFISQPGIQQPPQLVQSPQRVTQSSPSMLQPIQSGQEIQPIQGQSATPTNTGSESPLRRKLPQFAQSFLPPKNVVQILTTVNRLPIKPIDVQSTQSQKSLQQTFPQQTGGQAIDSISKAVQNTPHASQASVQHVHPKQQFSTGQHTIQPIKSASQASKVIGRAPAPPARSIPQIKQLRQSVQQNQPQFNVGHTTGKTGTTWQQLPQQFTGPQTGLLTQSSSHVTVNQQDPQIQPKKHTLVHNSVQQFNRGKQRSQSVQQKQQTTRHITTTRKAFHSVQPTQMVSQQANGGSRVYAATRPIPLAPQLLNRAQQGTRTGRHLVHQAVQQINSMSPQSHKSIQQASPQHRSGTPIALQANRAISQKAQLVSIQRKPHQAVRSPSQNPPPGTGKNMPLTSRQVAVRQPTFIQHQQISMRVPQPPQPPQPPHSQIPKTPQKTVSLFVPRLNTMNNKAVQVPIMRSHARRRKLQPVNVFPSRTRVRFRDPRVFKSVNSLTRPSESLEAILRRKMHNSRAATSMVDGYFRALTVSQKSVVPILQRARNIYGDEKLLKYLQKKFGQLRTN